jgi:hypothetical protein
MISAPTIELSIVAQRKPNNLEMNGCGCGLVNLFTKPTVGWNLALRA